MKKNFVTGIVVGGLFFGTVGAFAGQYVATKNTFPIKINGQDAYMEGYNIDGSTYFKLRDIGDRMGFTVDFKNNTILLSDGTYQYEENQSEYSDEFYDFIKEVIVMADLYTSANDTAWDTSEAEKAIPHINQTLFSVRNDLDYVNHLLTKKWTTGKEYDFTLATYHLIQSEIKLLESMRDLAQSSLPELGIAPNAETLETNLQQAIIEFTDALDALIATEVLQGLQNQ